MPVRAKLQMAARLELLGKLATGGMGTVWLARIAESGELIALKRMHRQLAKSGEFLSMFLDEIWMTGELDHPNVVALVGWGVDQDGPYLATELVRGAPLSSLAEKAQAASERLAPELVAFVGGELARGLHAAHELRGSDGRPLGLVHRDLTPSNVLVGFDGSVKITDFGVAKAARKIVETGVGVLKGKAHFMAPEYIRGEALDGRSDLYSLGVVLFELLAGQRPFAAISSDVELLQTAARADPPPLGERVAVDGELAAIVDELRANRPDQRFSSAAALAERLDGWLAARQVDRAECREELGVFALRYGQTQIHRFDTILAGAEPSEVMVIEDSAPQTRTVAPPLAAATPLVPSTPPAAATPSIRSTPPSGPPGDEPTRPAEVTPAATRAVAAPVLVPDPIVAAAPTAADDEAAASPEPKGAPQWLPLYLLAAIAVAAAVALVARDRPNDHGAPQIPAPQATVERARDVESTAAASPGPPPLTSPTASASGRAERTSPPRTEPGRLAPAGGSAKRRARACTPADFDYPNCRER